MYHSRGGERQPLRNLMLPPPHGSVVSPGSTSLPSDHRVPYLPRFVLEPLNLVSFSSYYLPLGSALLDVHSELVLSSRASSLSLLLSSASVALHSTIFCYPFHPQLVCFLLYTLVCPQSATPLLDSTLTRQPLLLLQLPSKPSRPVELLLLPFTCLLCSRFFQDFVHLRLRKLRRAPFDPRKLFQRFTKSFPSHPECF